MILIGALSFVSVVSFGLGYFYGLDRGRGELLLREMTLRALRRAHRNEL